ncbi:MAG: hypothetical protein ACO3ND_06040 [Opitutales bacterium]
MAEDPAGTLPARARRALWSRLGGEGLTVSLAVHLLLVLLAAFWVVATVSVVKKRDPDTFATGAGGGSAGNRNTNDRHKTRPSNIKSVIKSPTRITSRSTANPLAVAALPVAPMSPISGGMLSGSGSKGFGGGAGGGIGSGVGLGRGGRNFVSLFGARGFTNGLAGEFWDIKRAKDKRPLITLRPGVGGYGYTDDEIADYFRAIRNVIVAKGDATSALSKYFRADAVLSANGIFQPTMDAAEAPKAFGVEKDVAPVLWLGVYRARIRAPFADQFRFVGGCDNVMVVIVNGKVVLDGSLKHMPGSSARHYYASEWKQKTPPIPAMPAGPPTNNFKFVYGDWIRMDSISDTEITILLGESGGKYGAFLAIDYKSANWHRKGGALPPGGFLPVFLVGKPDSELRELMTKAGEPARFRPFLDGPVFTSVRRGTRP